ncbi:MAG: hypothetical protein KIT34_04815 [Cyanobacteria bacterium TGS_CYA1]|nr:hypothetical protein [Cyanobacteria bacterium TGS_CYA1]
MKTKKSWSFLIPGIVVAMTTPSPAFAIDFDSLVRAFTGGNTGATSSYSQNFIRTNLNAKRTQLETDITSGIASGQLTTDEANDLRNDLNKISIDDSSFSSDANLTRYETQNLIDQYEAVSRKLNTYLTNVATNSSVIGGSTADTSQWFRRYGHGKNSANQAERRARIDTLQAEVGSLISTGVYSGKLNQVESTNFRNELNSISTQESTALRDNRLSSDETDQLANRLVSLKTAVTDATNRPSWGGGWNGRRGRGRGNAHAQINTQQTLLAQRINAGISSGQLTRSEADRLLADEAKINSLNAQLSASGGRLSWDEQRRILNELDQLSRKINKELYDRQVR